MEGRPVVFHTGSVGIVWWGIVTVVCSGLKTQTDRPALTLVLIPYPDAFYRHSIAAGQYPYGGPRVDPLKRVHFIKHVMFSRPSDYGVDPVNLCVFSAANGT